MNNKPQFSDFHNILNRCIYGTDATSFGLGLENYIGTNDVDAYANELYSRMISIDTQKYSTDIEDFFMNMTENDILNDGYCISTKVILILFDKMKVFDNFDYEILNDFLFMIYDERTASGMTNYDPIKMDIVKKNQYILCRFLEGRDYFRSIILNRTATFNNIIDQIMSTND